jgi:hypothetical protein
VISFVLYLVTAVHDFSLCLLRTADLTNADQSELTYAVILILLTGSKYSLSEVSLEIGDTILAVKVNAVLVSE